MAKTAIMVDGGFYRKRARALWGDRSPELRAEELYRYVFKHLNKRDGDCSRELYRVFYYDCPPVRKNVYHPLLQKSIAFGKDPMYEWANKFYDELKAKRKFALRMGRLSDNDVHFQLDPVAVKRLCAKKVTVEELAESDFHVTFKQKGVDMKLGIDVSSLAYEGIVDQIVLVAGDSDFVPAAKVARRKGIDFILDPMGNHVNSDLLEHIDGLESLIKYDPISKREPEAKPV